MFHHQYGRDHKEEPGGGDKHKGAQLKKNCKDENTLTEGPCKVSLGRLRARSKKETTGVDKSTEIAGKKSKVS